MRRALQSVNPLFRTQSLSVEIENLIIRATHTDLELLDLPLPLVEVHTLLGLSHQDIVARFRAFDDVDLQADDEALDPEMDEGFDYGDEAHTNRTRAALNFQGWTIMFRHLGVAMRSLPSYNQHKFTDLLEGFMILRHWHTSCTSMDDYYMLMRTAYMSFTGRSVTGDVLEWLWPQPELQSLEDVVKAMRQAMDLGKSVIDCELMKKLRRMYTYLLVQGVLQKVGLEPTPEEFAYLSKKAPHSKFGSRINMWVHIVDTALFICERYLSYKKTGSIHAFIQDSSECEDWVQAADKLLALAPFTANLEPHGTTYFRFLSDLSDAIDKGQAYAKAFRVMGADRTNPIVRKLGALMLLKNAEVTKRASLQSRHAPLGVLIYGHSGVAKSSFTRVLYHAYGSLFGLDRDDHYLYTRSPANEYWVNFDSSMWAVQMDDIAFLKPSATSDVDPTLKELLNVVNNVPYTPPQASLEDKGKTPVLAKLVLATTNCENLNAHEYFHCPLAVRRRLPYVIEVEPKPQYRQDNGIFIEPKSLPDATPGYPDFWNITVKKLVPALQNDGSELATLEVVKQFSDIREFIKHFGAFAKEHRTNQSKGEAAEAFIKQVELCPLCCSYKEDCACELQAYAPVEFVGYYVMYAYVSVLTWWMGFGWFHSACTWLARYRFTRWITTYWVLPYLSATRFVRFMVDAHRVVQTNKVQICVTFLAMLATALSVYAYASQATRKQTVRATTAESVVEVLIRDEHEGYETEEGVKRTVTLPNMEPQGNVMGTTEDDLPTEATTNVWYRETVELQSFDMPLSSTSLVGKQPEEIRNMFERNMVAIAVKALDGPYRCNTRGFFYRGTTLVMNAHPLKGTEFELTILRGKRGEGVRPMITIRVKKSDFKIRADRDTAVINVPSMAPARDLSKFWCENIIPVDKMIGVGRDKAGDCDVRIARGVFFAQMPLKGLEGEYPIFIGKSTDDTKNGDCGTAYLAATPRGYTFVGMHVAGYETQAGVMRILKHELDELCEDVQPACAVISGVGEPLLSLQDSVKLLDPHTKSVFRYLETGSCEMYGRLPGFLPKPRSKVTSTPLREVMENHYGEACGFTQPAMDGWAPVRNNVKEMVVPNVKYDPKILDDCKRAFLADILTGLPEGWEGQVMEFSDIAAVNGLPGVKYVDKLNTNSSMGFPWNKSKKKFLSDEPSDKYPKGVNFPEDVWERVREVERTYDEGRRVFPVFNGHNKDEAVTHAKRKAQKTRLFASGPIHWMLSVRKTLLSFVKLVQENKLTFEAGPGTVCQSREWEQLREYLTKFGLGRLVAGDYSKFDKRMIADFIMAAYWIIAEVHRAAGHDDKMYRRIMGIGTDTAYPVMNIRGEIVMFYGTNPSGHPLTVIINSLVNSLYMRYAFAVLGYDVRQFKVFVALMTYGDDNVMGVSVEVPRFNHTSIQEVLAAIGVTYTMADKESDSIAYIHIDDVSFLKRKWRYDADVGAYVCPLEEDSIKKSLMCWLPSSTICPEHQMVEVVQAAVNEYFWYGKEIFAEKRAFFQGCVAGEPFSEYVTDSTFPTWQELNDRFWGASC